MWTDAPDPYPKGQVTPYTPILWPAGAVVDLVKPVEVKQSYGDVVAARRSNRSFGPLSASDLSALLWYACRQVARRPSGLGFDLSLRHAPSAGAIHPIHVLIHSNGQSAWQRYDAAEHRLIEVPRDVLAPQSAVAEVSPALALEKGTILWLAAEVGKTASKYANVESLIWRDAGALLAHLGLAASSLGLNFCPLGLTGAKWGLALYERKLIRGVGVALVGTPAIADIPRYCVQA
jgi:SagB-type dehydrogenase family enzyme